MRQFSSEEQEIMRRWDELPAQTQRAFTEAMTPEVVEVLIHLLPDAYDDLFLRIAQASPDQIPQPIQDEMGAAIPQQGIQAFSNALGDPTGR